jgi:hypothetical protein
MFDDIELGIEFFEGLLAVDEAIVKQAAEEACRFCGGPLHRGDFPRKPRGGLLGLCGEVFRQRFSLCCGREGCRRRATPPSVRFLGRRIYLGAVVVVASAIAVAVRAANAIREATGVPARTLRRWLRWWRGPFIETSVFVEMSARLVPVLQRRRLPASLLERLSGESVKSVEKLLAWLTPLTTASLPDGSRFVRGLM